MGNINTLLVHRINDNKTTDYISKWVGTYKAQDYQAGVSGLHNDGIGLVKIVDKFHIAPTELQRLDTGEAYIISKVGGFGYDKAKINYLG